MSKLLIVFGLIILLVMPPSYSSEEKAKMSGEKNKKSSGVERQGGCSKAKFIKTDGKEKHCNSHADCYDQREPQDWCILKDGQSWTDKGCFCDSKKHLCIIERKNGDMNEYAFCSSQENWKCNYN